MAFWHLIDCFLVLVFLLLTCGVGCFILNWSEFSTSSRLHQLLFSFGAGAASISLILFLTGTAGYFKLGLVTVMALLLVVGLPGLRIFKKIHESAKLMLTHLLSSRTNVLILVLLLFQSLLNLIGALAPPTEPDSLSYHLGAIEVFLDQGRISFIPYRHWPAPFSSEMWNLLAFLLGRPQMAQLFVWGFGCFFALAIFALGRQLSSPRVGLLAAGLAYLSPEIITLSASAKSDLLMLFFFSLSVLSLFEWLKNGERPWLMACGLCTSMVLACKNVGLFWGLTMACGVLLGSLMEREVKFSRRITNVLIWGGCTALLVSPWWLRNWVEAGDPLWPLAYRFLESSDWSQQLDDKYSAFTRGLGHNPINYLLGLWNLTTRTQSFSGTGSLGLMLAISPIPLALIPALGVVWGQLLKEVRRFIQILGPMILIYYTAWFWVYQHPRYFLPILSLLAVLAALIFWHLTEFVWARFFAHGLILSSLIFMVLLGSLFQLQFLSVVTGRVSVDDFLKEKVSFYDDCQWANANLPEKSKLLFFPLKTFYMKKSFLRADPNLWDYTSPDRFIEQLEQRGITHIFLPEQNAFLGEYGMELIRRDLKGRGKIEPVYFNPKARVITSRTLSQHTTVPLVIYRFIRPTAKYNLLP